MTRIATLNVRSIKNKDHLIVNELNDNNIDIAVITEMRLKDTKEDQAWLDQSEFKQGNYNTLVQNRPSNKKGVRIGIAYSKPYKMIQFEGGHRPTIEFSVWKIVIKKQTHTHSWPIPSPTKCSNSNCKWHVLG